MKRRKADIKSRKSYLSSIRNENGDHLMITLKDEGGVLLGKVFVDTVPYHVFFAKQNEIKSNGKYIIDKDPDYRPKPSPSGMYLLIAPYSD